MAREYIAHDIEGIDYADRERAVLRFKIDAAQNGSGDSLKVIVPVEKLKQALPLLLTFLG